jgi:DNA-binding transcriptional LysR family regulator
MFANLPMICCLPRPTSRRGWSDLAGRRFIGNSSYSLAAAPELKELVRNQAVYIPNIISLLAIIRDGDGITLLPRINNLHAGRGVAFRSLKDTTVRRQVGFITKAGRSLSPAGRAFLTALRGEIAEKSKGLEIHLI